jgi:hypothetical protein
MTNTTRSASPATDWPLPICPLSHSAQAILRAVFAYFMNVPPEEIPRLSMPLHTLIELTPMPDGTMTEQRFPVDICRDLGYLLGGVDVGLGVKVAHDGSPLGSGGGAELPVLSAPGTAAEDFLTSGASPLSISSGNSGVLQEAAGSALVPASPAPSNSGGDAETAESEPSATATQGIPVTATAIVEIV